jgi:hypothetical protein
MTGMRPSDVRGGFALLRRNLVTTGLGQVVGCEPGARKRDGARDAAFGADGGAPASTGGSAGGASAARIAGEPSTPLGAAPFTAGGEESFSS